MKQMSIYFLIFIFFVVAFKYGYFSFYMTNNNNKKKKTDEHILPNIRSHAGNRVRLKGIRI